MATLTGGTHYSINFDTVQLERFYLYPHSTLTERNALFYYNENSYSLFKGTGFTYNTDDEPTGGTIKSFLNVDGSAFLLLFDEIYVSAKVLYDFAAVNDSVGFHSAILYGNDTMTGSTLGDVLRGYGGNDLVSGLRGADILYGGLGNDTLWGGLGNDVLYGDAGNDLIDGGDGGNTAKGGSGNDTIIAAAGAVFADGGTGIDTFDLRAYGGNYIWNMATGVTSFSDETAANFEVALLGAGRDVIVGTTRANTIDGGGGIDNLAGGQGADVLSGGGASDRLFGNSGGDTLNGSAGNDGLNGGGGNDKLAGGPGADNFVFDTAAFGADTISDFVDNLDKLQFRNSVANAFSDLSIAGNGTANLTVTVIGLAGQSVVVHGVSPITLNAADVVFFG